MHEASALRVAIDLMHVPSRVRAARLAPLPPQIDVVLRIAAGDQAAEIEAARITERSREVVREASIFFIEQILLHPEADSYRVLGATPQAKTQELRHNMALLLRWLHPDMDRDGERAILARRVTRAWEELKTPTRRAEHDSAEAALAETSRHAHNGGRLGRRSRGKSAKLVRVPLTKNPGFLLRILRYLLIRAPH
jgi:hypothetical protein